MSESPRQTDTAYYILGTDEGWNDFIYEVTPKEETCVHLCVHHSVELETWGMFSSGH